MTRAEALRLAHHHAEEALTALLAHPRKQHLVRAGAVLVAEVEAAITEEAREEARREA